MTASSRGDVDMVQCLIDCKADPSIKDNFGNTAKKWAKANQCQEIVDLLANYKKKRKGFCYFIKSTNYHPKYVHYYSQCLFEYIFEAGEKKKRKEAERLEWKLKEEEARKRNDSAEVRRFVKLQADDLKKEHDKILGKFKELQVLPTTTLPLKFTMILLL